MPQTFYEVVCIFIIYAFIGWCTEVAYAALETGKFVNRGFLNGPYCPIYGVGVLSVLVVLIPLKHNVFILYVGSFLLTSAIEFVTGFVLEKVFHNKWWDYSDMPFNIMGYVCLKFSILWGFACTFIVLIVHPVIYGFIQLIPHIVGVVALIVIMTAFAVDLAVTVSTIVKFNKRLKLMNEIAVKLKRISDDIGENVYENVMEALEKKEKFTDAALERKEKLTDAAEEVKENLRKEQRSLRQRYSELLEQKSVSQNRLLRAFPGMKSAENDEVLQKLKKKLWKKDK